MRRTKWLSVLLIASATLAHAEEGRQDLERKIADWKAEVQAHHERAMRDHPSFPKAKEHMRAAEEASEPQQRLEHLQKAVELLREARRPEGEKRKEEPRKEEPRKEEPRKEEPKELSERQRAVIEVLERAEVAARAGNHDDAEHLFAEARERFNALDVKPERVAARLEKTGKMLHDLFAEHRQPRPAEPREREAQPGDKRPGAGDIIHRAAEISPEWGEELAAMRTRGEPRFEAAIDEARRNFAELDELRRQDPEGAELALKNLRLSRSIERLARSVREHPDDEHLRHELSTDVTTLFDLRLQMDARQLERAATELARMREQLDHERETLARRREHKADLIEERMAELLGRERLKDW